MLASERTGIPIERIQVFHGDTDVVPKGPVTGGSRSAQRAGVAVAKATDELVEEARAKAAELLEAAVGDVVLDVGRGAFHVAGAPGAASVDWVALAGSLAGNEPEDDPVLACESDAVHDGPSVPFGMYAAVVSVDTETGAVTLQRMVSVDDAGTVINPLLVEGQLQGAIVQGIGQALYEEFVYDADGNPQTGSFLDYAFPSAAELPDLEVHVVSYPSPNNPLGVKGIAESGAIGAVPAIQNAVVDALADLGIRHIDMPLTPQRVWSAIGDLDRSAGEKELSIMVTARRGAMLRRELTPEDEIGQATAIAPFVDELWIVEDLPYAGGIAQLGPVLAATADDGVTVGHGIAPAPFRHPVALAMEWATLARMYPGRLQAGVGHGVPSWMAQLGSRPASPLTLLEETIDTVRRLLSGEAVDVDGRYVTARDVALEFPPIVVPPVSAGVVGPKSLDLSARVADGTILPEGQGPDAVAHLRDLAGPDHRITVFTGFYCGDLDLLPPPPEHLPPGWAAIGPNPEAVAAELTALAHAGADAIVLVPFADDQVAQLDLAAADVWPLVG